MIVLLTFSVGFTKFAEGGSEVTAPSSDSSSESSVSATNEPSINCEDISDLSERVKCRFDHGTTQQSVPEGCRVLSDTTSCQEMYATSQTCYHDMSGVQRDQCLRDVVGFQAGMELSAEYRTQYERYLLLLLYDLEYYIEEEFLAGNIDAQTSTDLIVEVIEMKHLVLNGASKAELQTALDNYKTSWGAR